MVTHADDAVGIQISQPIGKLVAVFASLLQMRAEGLVIGGEPILNSRSEQLGALTARHKVPAIFQFREFTAGGGLVSYGASLTDAYRQVGVYAARILKG